MHITIRQASAIAIMASLLVWPVQANAQADLSGGLKAKFKNTSAGKQKAVVKFKGLPPVTTPGCPDESWIRFTSSSGDSGRIALECERWQSRNGRHRYKGDRNAESGLAKITLVPGALKGKLVIKLKRTGGDSPVVGPVNFVEARMGTGEESKICGRFTTANSVFARNEPGQVAARGPTISCPAFAGERAFFDALHGTADTSAEAVTLLDQAIDDVPTDGLAALWLGMNHIMRASDDLDWRSPTEFARDELNKAQAALDIAVSLLPDDLRVPGWRAAATWSAGTANEDADRIALGLDQLRAAIELYPLFNTFDFVGITAVTPPNDPLYAEALAYMDAALSGNCSPFTDAEVCGNAGAAPHNVEGTGLLFGDIYLKGGRLEDARYWYELGLSYDALDSPAGDWAYAYLTEERLADLEGRMALYQDNDPDNDPPLVGSAAGGAACAVCHYN